MKIDVSKEIPDEDTLQLEESISLKEELAREGTIIFEDESIILHHANYEKESKNISLQWVSIKGKNLVEKWGSKIEIIEAYPKGDTELHRATNEDLAHIMDDQENKISR